MSKGVEKLGWKNIANGDEVNIVTDMKMQKASQTIPASDIDTPCTQEVNDAILGGAKSFAVLV